MEKKGCGSIALGMFLLLVAMAFGAMKWNVSADSAYRKEIEQWRQDRAKSVGSPDGWLAVAGLFWLEQGENRIGTDDKDAVVLPKRLPKHIGTLVLKGDEVKAVAVDGVKLLLNGKPFIQAELKSDAVGKPDQLSIDSCTFFVIKRGDRIGVRLKDSQSEHRLRFKGLEWYPIREDWRILANFVPYDPPRTMKIASVIGTQSEMKSPGYVTFTRDGKEYRLTPVEEDGKLFFMLRDKTSGDTTYGASRFLYAEMPIAGKVILDFNRATNPPCAYTAFATCPLPPAENTLDVAITAGEKTYPDH
jgi:uncharacterized protein (DUF1684 family)